MLRQFGVSDAAARRAYRHFVRAAVDNASQRDLDGGGLRRDVLAARAVVSHLAVRHHGLSLSAVGRHLSVSKQPIARALERAAAVYVERDCLPVDLLDN